jgi:hypothetical protein
MPQDSTRCARRRNHGTRRKAGSRIQFRLPLREAAVRGPQPYIESIERSLAYLRQVLRNESWRMLRRSPQVLAAEPDSLTSVRGLMTGYFKRAWSQE